MYSTHLQDLLRAVRRTAKGIHYHGQGDDVWLGGVLYHLKGDTVEWTERDISHHGSACYERSPGEPRDAEVLRAALLTDLRLEAWQQFQAEETERRVAELVRGT